MSGTFCSPRALGPVTDQLGTCLGAAFQNAPDYAFILARHPHKMRALAWFFGRFATSLCLRFGAVHASSGGDAGILCLAPGRAPSLLGLLRAGVLCLPWRFGLRGTFRACSLGITMERLRLTLAPMPHWYVVSVGVRPERQGEGLGHALLTRVLAQADADGVPCYLEAFEQALADHYVRRGFRVLHTRTLGSGLTLWCLLRTAA